MLLLLSLVTCLGTDRNATFLQALIGATGRVLGQLPSWRCLVRRRMLIPWVLSDAADTF